MPTRLPLMLWPSPGRIAGLALIAVAAAGCAKRVEQTAAAAPAASSAAPVQWDMASKDPAKNPVEANKEPSVPGYIP